VKPYKIKEAAEEARRFLRTVDQLEARLKTDPYFNTYVGTGTGFKETAAVRRASINLTRALADMRQP
jgi:hypothetical protein